MVHNKNLCTPWDLVGKVRNEKFMGSQLSSPLLSLKQSDGFFIFPERRGELGVVLIPNALWVPQSSNSLVKSNQKRFNGHGYF